LGDPSAARNDLGWEPKVNFDELMKEMTLADLDLAKRDQLVDEAGFRVYSQHE
jgi:GDPmannose 4,6-dehydratase